MSFTQILVERRGAVELITLNRPERLNAWTTRMSVELGQAITAANDDPDVGAIVLTGAGRGFCAGADIGGEFAAQIETGRTPGATDAGAAPRVDWVQLCRSSKPLLAAINGAAIGVGLTMILPFDRLVAASSAKLSARFVRMGLVPELASSHFLVTRCGWGNASWLALTGDTVQGEEAARLGLVDRVVADDQVLEATLADAAVMASSPMPQVRMIKELLTKNADETDLAEVQRRELEALQVSYKTPEHKEAVSAFLAKRPPNFRNL